MNRDFGQGPEELTGALDLIDRFKLVHHHEFFFKKSTAGMLSKAPFINSVAGALGIIREGDGVRLGQLVQKELFSATRKRGRIQVFDFVDLTEAFKFKGLAALPRGSKHGCSKIDLKNNKQQEDKVEEIDRECKKPRNIHNHLNKHLTIKARHPQKIHIFDAHPNKTETWQQIKSSRVLGMYR